MGTEDEKKKKSHGRAPGMTQISISLPVELVNKVDRLAEKYRRSRSNFIAEVLRALKEDEDQEPTYLQAAEPRTYFGTDN